MSDPSSQGNPPTDEPGGASSGANPPAGEAGPPPPGPPPPAAPVPAPPSPPTAPPPPVPAQPAVPGAGVPPPPPPSGTDNSGCVKVGLIVVAVLAVVGLAVAGLFVFVINRAVEELDSTFGRADPSDYEVEITDCSVDSFGDVQASGTLRNVSDEQRSFSIEVRFLEGGRDLITSSTDTTASLQPGERGNWNVITFDEPASGEFSCEVGEVDYAGS